MELDELIENTLRRKHLEEMLSRPEREHTPLEGMDADQIKRFALFLYEENQNKRTQLDEMIARLDEIGKDLKDVKRENASLLKALLEANSKAEKVVLESKLRDKEYKTLEKKYRALVERLSRMNSQVYSSSKSLKGIDRKKSCKGKHDDKDDFDGTPQSPVPTEEAADQPQESQSAKQSKDRPERKGMTYRKQVVGTPVIHKSDYSRIPAGAVVISSSYKKVRNIVSHIEEHHFEKLKIKHPDGRIEKIYLPIPGLPKKGVNQLFACAMRYPRLHGLIEQYARLAMREDEWYNNLNDEYCAMPGTFAVFALGMEGLEPKRLRLVCDYLDLCDDEHSSLQEKFIHAFFKKFGFLRQTMPVLLHGVRSMQSLSPAKEFGSLIANDESLDALLEIKSRLADYLPEEDEDDEEAKDFLWRDTLWAIWGKASENGGGKVVKAAPDELKEKYRRAFEPVKD